MLKITKAIKEISISKSIPTNQILYKKINDSKYYLLDCGNRDLYKFENNLVSLCLNNQSFDYGANNANPQYNNMVTDVFTSNLNPNTVANDFFNETYGGRNFSNLYSEKANYGIDQFTNVLKEWLLQKYPNMNEEISNFINQNVTAIYRAVGVKKMKELAEIDRKRKGGSKRRS